MPRRFGSSSYCIACRLRLEACVCAWAPRLCLNTRITLIVHAGEWRKVGNTGHLLRLAAAGTNVRVHGAPKRLLNDDVDWASTLALFPGCGAAPLTVESVASLPRPITLLVPDGNWIQTKHMMRRLPMLRQARPVRLQGPRLDLPNVRRNDDAERRSTFEAVAQMLGVLEGADVEGRMLDFFRRVLRSKTTYGVRQGRDQNR